MCDLSSDDVNWAWQDQGCGWGWSWVCSLDIMLVKVLHKAWYETLIFSRCIQVSVALELDWSCCEICWGDQLDCGHWPDCWDYYRSYSLSYSLQLRADHIFSKGEILCLQRRQQAGAESWSAACYTARPAWPEGSRAAQDGPAPETENMSLHWPNMTIINIET